MNIGGYDNNSINEELGNALLIKLLVSGGMIMPHINSKDKVPNTDGFIEILKESYNKKIPIGRFEVQIKTLNHDYTNKNHSNNSQYKYSCDTKIFNVVKNGNSLNPCLLFLIDVNKEVVFYKYISFEYLMELNITNEESKTIYFNDSDSINDIKEFYNTLYDIYNDARDKLFSLRENSIVTNFDLTSQEIKLLQDEFDFLNGVFDGEFKIIKEKLFFNAWKIGIAYLKNEKGTYVGIYLITRGKNDEFIKRFNTNNTNQYTHMHFCSGNYSLHDILLNFIKSAINSAFSYRIVPKIVLSNEALFEIIFVYLDKIATIDSSLRRDNVYNSIYYKDIEDFGTIKHYYSALYSYSYNKLNEIIPMNDNDSLYLADPLHDRDEHSIFDLNELSQYFHMNNLPRYDKEKILLKGKYNYNLLDIAIEELERRNINCVSRIWILKDYEKAKNNVFEENQYVVQNGFSFDDFYKNVYKLMDYINNGYKMLFENSQYFKISNKRIEFLVMKKIDTRFILQVIAKKSDRFSIRLDNNTEIWSSDEIHQKIINGEYLSAVNMSIATIFNSKYCLSTILIGMYYYGVSQTLQIKDFNLKGAYNDDICINLAKIFIKDYKFINLNN